jgi:hypothetical protein
MKTILISLLCLLVGNRLYSQIDSIAESFFPHHVGDAWEYDAISQKYKLTLTADSIKDGSHYLYYNNSATPRWRIDSSLKVFSYPATKIYSIDLKAPLDSFWIVSETHPRIVARVDEMYGGVLFGVPTQIKRIGYYYEPYPDTTSFVSWRNDAFYAAGFGYFLSINDASQTPDEQLIGCIVDGNKYGTLTSVKGENKNFTPLSYKLYPSFPNPFNPSTTISYFLPIRNKVNISVYDILGKEVDHIIDGFKNAGLHSSRFEPKNLSSGIYFVRMTVGNFIQTNKIIYSK